MISSKKFADRSKRFKKRRHAVLLTLLLMALLLLATAFLLAEPYKGRLIDEQSGQPIQGALALGYWNVMIPNAGGGTTHCLYARETISDEKGEFRIPISA